MEAEEKTGEPKVSNEFKHLIIKLTNDFKNHVSSQSDLSVVLLKGHLLIEYFLNQLIIINDLQTNVSTAGFKQKIDELKSKSIIDQTLCKHLERLNKTRNDMAHTISFELNESNIDSLGYTFGKEYVLKKYEIGPENLKDQLVWILDEILVQVVILIHLKIKKIKAEKKLES